MEAYGYRQVFRVTMRAITSVEAVMKKHMSILFLLTVLCVPMYGYQDKGKDGKPVKWGELKYPRGTSVTVKIPLEALDNKSFYFKGTVEKIDGKLTVNGHSDWESLGIPLLLYRAITINKVERDKESQNKNAKLAIVQ